MSSYEVTIDRAAWDRALRSPTGPVGRWLASRGVRAQNAARRRANVDTGLMRSRTEFRIESEAGALVGVLAARTSYARYVHRSNPFLRDAVRETMR